MPTSIVSQNGSEIGLKLHGVAEALRRSKLPQSDGAFIEPDGKVCALTAAAIELSGEMPDPSGVIGGKTIREWLDDKFDAYFGVDKSLTNVRVYCDLYLNRGNIPALGVKEGLSVYHIVTSRNDVHHETFAQIADIIDECEPTEVKLMQEGNHDDQPVTTTAFLLATDEDREATNDSK